MTENENDRAARKSHGGMSWPLLLTAVGLLSAAVIQAGVPGRQVGAMACVGLSIPVFYQAFRIRDRRSHEELVQEIEFLWQAFEQLKKDRR